MNNINLTTVLVILFAHWVADFVCQTDKMAKGKSKNMSDLMLHTFVYSMAITLFVGITYILIEPYPHNDMFWNRFFAFTFICHTITDYFTSRLNSKLWAKGDTHNFFVSIGFDQFLHYAQLFITYQLLK